MSRLPPPTDVPTLTRPIVLQSEKKTVDNDVLEESVDSKASSIDHGGIVERRRKGHAFVSSVSTNEPVTTRRELWSYYLYYNGDNGVGPNGFSMTLFQSLATGAGYDPVNGPGSSCTADNASGRCVVPWSGGTKSVSSVVLVTSANQVCAVQFYQDLHKKL